MLGPRPTAGWPAERLSGSRPAGRSTSRPHALLRHAAGAAGPWLTRPARSRHQVLSVPRDISRLEDPEVPRGTVAFLPLSPPPGPAWEETVVPGVLPQVEPGGTQPWYFSPLAPAGCSWCPPPSRRRASLRRGSEVPIIEAALGTVPGGGRDVSGSWSPPLLKQQP